VTQRQVDASLASGQPPAMANTGHTPGAAPAASSGAAPADAGAGHQLPKTASPLPLVALLGGVFLAVGAGMTLRRRRLA
jgi:LPXTG-motif cell wall-anchored protein